jgi:hypothetical protein
MKSAVFGLVCAGVLVVPVMANAQTQKKSAPKKIEARSNTPTPAPVKAFEPVFWTDDAPLQSYEGNDAEAVFKWLGAKIRSVKGMPDQFSTPEQKDAYVAAVAQEMAKVGTIAMPTKCWGKKYDPAKQGYTVSAYLTSAPKELKLPFEPYTENLRVGRVKTVELKKEMVVAQNAYGAKFDVLKINEETYSALYSGKPGQEPSSLIADTNKEGQFFDKLQKATSTNNKGLAAIAQMDYQWKSVEYKTNFPLPSDQARAEDEDIQCMYVLSIQAPYILSYDQALPATRDYPTDRLSYNHYMYGKLDRFIVYNKKSGKVYAQANRDGL